MAQREIHTSTLHRLVGQLSYAAADITINSSSLDTQLFEAVEFYLSTTVVHPPGNRGVTFVIQDSPDNSIWTDVTQEFTVGDLTQQVIDYDTITLLARLGYVGSQRYVRISGTSGSGAGLNQTIIVIGVLGESRQVPSPESKMPPAG